MTDNQALFSNVHHLKGNMDDYRLQTKVLAIRQSIEVDKIAQELRYCLSEENIADCLTQLRQRRQTTSKSRCHPVAARTNTK